MKRIFLMLTSLFFGVLLSSGRVDAITSEQWKLVLDNGQGHGQVTLFQQTNQKITADGSWKYLYQGHNVSGSYAGAYVTINGSAISIKASGTATDPSAPPGYQSSPFNLSIAGTAVNGQGNGSFTLSFQNPTWINGFSGSWTGTRTSGKGITAENPEPPPVAEPKGMPWLQLLLSVQARE